MKIRTAVALAVLAVSPAFAGEAAVALAGTDEAMTSTEKVESLQKEIATLEKAVDQVRQASAERATMQAKQQAEVDIHPLWP